MRKKRFDTGGTITGAEDEIMGLGEKLQNIGDTAKSALGSRSPLGGTSLSTTLPTAGGVTAQTPPGSNNINAPRADGGMAGMQALAKGGKVRGCGVASKGLTKGRMR